MKDTPGIEAALELTETALDQLITSELLANLPVVGIAFKVCKSISGIRERYYISKLASFVRALERVPDEDRQDMLGLALTGEEERRKIGERLLLTLEQLSDSERPELMGTFFIAFIRSRIDQTTLFRCWDAIETGYSGDLKDLLAAGVTNLDASDRDGYLQNLLRTGLSKIQGLTAGNDGHMYYELSAFGKLFVTTYHENTMAEHDTANDS
ncbi:MAG: hypothetical protein ABL974_23025 [Prosthecobacter sp.]